MASTISPDNIRSIHLFAGLSERDKDTLLQAGRIHRYVRGEHLFLHGDPIAHFYIICSGTVQLFRESPDGHEKTTDIRIGGQTIGKAEILEGVRVHQVNAVATGDVVAMEFPIAWLGDTAKKYNVFALNLLSAISRHARDAEIEAEHQSMMSSSQLVACLLQRICILHDYSPCGFELPYSKTLIASRLGIELETFSRTLSMLKEQGITITGTHVVIHDLKGIDQYVCAHCSVADECRTHQVLGEQAAVRKKM